MMGTERASSRTDLGRGLSPTDQSQASQRGLATETGGDACVASPEPQSRLIAPSPVAGELHRAPT